jgi:selenocysteine-specific elongation factor
VARPAFKAGEPRQPRGGKVRLLRRSVPRPAGRRAGAVSEAAEPLTVGTAGHIDHGKTALVRALTGRDTDRLPEERARGMSIALGFAPLDVGGRLLSLVDVPGHERFVRTMVAGATGVDLFLLVVAADDGVMPQTREHAAVLRALGVDAGVVAITKCDLADPARARAEVRDLVDGDVPAVACSARSGAGVEDVRAALGQVAARVRPRAREGPAVLHVDRSFTVHGAGTVVTGTLWSGSLGAGDRVRLLPAGRRARVRSVQVHDAPAGRAGAGQRVAVNLAGVRVDAVTRGDVVAAEEADLEPAWILDVALDLGDAEVPARAQIHHGTRETPARIVPRDDARWQLRCERPLLPRAGDRLVVRSIAPPGTLGGGRVLDPRARRTRRREAPVEAAPAPRPPRPEPGPLSPAALEIERRLREAADRPPRDAELGDGAAAALAELRAAGRAVRLDRTMHVHRAALDDVRARVVAIATAEGSITLARLRDELDTSRRYAQALLEALDAERVLLRLPDDSRVVRRSARGG